MTLSLQSNPIGIRTAFPRRSLLNTVKPLAQSHLNSSPHHPPPAARCAELGADVTHTQDGPRFAFRSLPPAARCCTQARSRPPRPPPRARARPLPLPPTALWAVRAAESSGGAGAAIAGSRKGSTERSLPPAACPRGRIEGSLPLPSLWCFLRFWCCFLVFFFLLRSPFTCA